MRMVRTTFFPCDPLPTQRLLVAGLALWALLLLLLAAPRAQGQAAAAPAGAAKAASASPAAQAARPAAQNAPKRGSGGMHEGIQVHGWWVIEVRRPNGKLISHTEFENSLVQGTGTEALAPILLGFTVPGGWDVDLIGSGTGGTGGPCSGGVYCHLVTSQLSAGCSGCGSLQTSLNSTPTGGPGSAVVLSGQVQSTQGGSIGAVFTYIALCPASTPPNALGTSSPAQCGANYQAAAPDISLSPFTQANLPNSSTTTSPCGGTGQISCQVTVPEAGDAISVTVTLSFQ
jgi:hypothetical protein